MRTTPPEKPLQLTTVTRRKSRGANLAILCAVGLMIIGFMGVSIYTGFQAYVQGELQKTTSTAALVGASAYYSGVGTYGMPSPNSAAAMDLAQKTFDNAITNSSKALKTFNFQVNSVTTNDSNDSITVQATGKIPTAFLKPVGIDNIEVNSTATARALRYEPTRYTGAVAILPISTDIASYSRVVKLDMPLVDNPGVDMYVEEDPTQQQGYVVEACNDQECYDVGTGATPIGTSKIVSQGGANVIYGTALIDLGKVGVRKATKLRFTHANQFDWYNAGTALPAMTTPTPLVITRVLLFGYAGVCINSGTCPIPAGFSPVQ